MAGGTRWLRPRPPLGSAAGAEEVFEQGGGFGGEEAFVDFEAVVEDVGIGEAELGAHAAEAEVAGGEDEAIKAGVDERAGAHDARFEGDVECGAAEAVIAEGEGGGAEGEDFGVGGGVDGGDRGVAGFGEERAVRADNDGADGGFAGFGGIAGQGEGAAHPEIVRGWGRDRVDIES